MPTASIVIPSRGGAGRLPHLVRCLQSQTRDDWEALVVVDGDIDGSEALMDQVDDRRFRVLVFPENRGRVAALNAGFEAGRGHVLIRCDDDLRPRPDYVHHHVEAHEGRTVGIVGLYRNVYPDTPYAAAYGRPMDETFRKQAYASTPARTWRYWAGNCSITRETWASIGPYDPDYRAYGWEDVDYGYRLHEAGISVELDPRLETDHHVAATTTLIRTTRAFLSGAARHKFEDKHATASLDSQSNGRQGLWDRAVGAVERWGSRSAIERASRLVDRLLPVLPRQVAVKSIALLVEGASAAGFRRPEETSTDV